MQEAQDAAMQEGQKVNPLRVFYWIVILLLTGSMAFYPDPNNHLGFFGNLLFFILGSGLGYLGALVGDMLRKFVMPEFVFTSGGFGQLFKTKLFWLIGPQCIGIIVGVFTGRNIIEKMFM